MDQSRYRVLHSGITCIDADYVQPGLACFYLLQEADEYAVIETGTSHSFAVLRELMSQRGIAPQQIRYVIPTHVHLDHAGGAGTMMAAFPEAQLLIHPRGERHMLDPTQLAASAMEVYGADSFHQLYGDIVPVAPSRVRAMEDGEFVELGDRRLQMRHTRGHANHHFCIWDEACAGWFSGDMFGLCYPWWRFEGAELVLPSTTPTQFDPVAYLASLELLASYQPQRMFLTHYGELDYSADKSALLAQQVRYYAEVAKQFMHDSSQLQPRITDYSMALLRRFDPDGDEQQHRQWLSFDIPLNAQGLMVWQDKQKTA